MNIPCLWRSAAIVLVLSSLAACDTGSTATFPDSPGAGVVPGGGGDSASVDPGETDDGAPVEPAVQPANLVAEHRSGQTFLTWPEADAQAQYNVYRSTQPITSENISAATRLTAKWGPLGADTSRHTYAGEAAPGNFVIADLTGPLTDDTGLFVYTVQEGEGGQVYYAVTNVHGSSESVSVVVGENSLAQPVTENIATPRPVLVRSVNGGKGRVYTQFMDYANWNPTFRGYAFNYAVALPADYNASRSYPLQVSLHAFGERYRLESQSEYDWQVIQVFPDDPGEEAGTVHTWWYGFAAEHDYLREGAVPTSGNIANFTEQRVMRAIDEVIANADFNVNTELVHVYGHSMGASGALTLGMRYGNILSGIYASQPMTNYRTSPTFEDNFVRIWGRKADNLNTVNDGPHVEVIKKYGVDGSEPTLVWDWMDHPRQLAHRRGDDMAYLMVDHGKADSTIDWQTQGQPFIRALTDARIGFSATSLDGAEHSWMSFGAVVNSLFGFGYGDEAAWRYPHNLSFPAIHNATGSGAVDPGNSGNDYYNTSIEWSTPWVAFDKTIVDQANRYEISLRSTSGADQQADITPRRTQAFQVAPGAQCSWLVVQTGSGQQMAEGRSIADQNGLLTVLAVPVSASGSRLSISC